MKNDNAALPYINDNIIDHQFHTLCVFFRKIILKLTFNVSLRVDKASSSETPLAFISQWDNILKGLPWVHVFKITIYVQ